MKGESGGSLVWIGIATVVAVGWFIYKMRKRQKEKKDTNRGIPRGNSGWPLLGETLEFIASGYTSRPVSFMEKRKSL